MSYFFAIYFKGIVERMSDDTFRKSTVFNVVQAAGIMRDFRLVAGE